MNESIELEEVHTKPAEHTNEVVWALLVRDRNHISQNLSS